jgi:hypothetical protein
VTTPLLHLPLNFERLEYVRRFARLQAVAFVHDLPKQFPVGVGHTAVLTVLRMWMDWATAGTDFRPLKLRFDTADSYDWASDDLTYVIEEYCEHDGGPGELIRHALLAGVMKIEFRDNNYGLVLADFWRFNDHLAPDYQTLQQRAAHAKHAKRKARLTEQSTLLAVEAQLAFDQSDVTEAEARQIVALVIRVDRACGLPVRPASEFMNQKPLMTAALRVVRNFKSEDIDCVCEYVMANRNNPRLVKLTERLLEKFGELLGKATHAKR